MGEVTYSPAAIYAISVLEFWVSIVVKDWTFYENNIKKQ